MTRFVFIVSGDLKKDTLFQSQRELFHARQAMKPRDVAGYKIHCAVKGLLFFLLKKRASLERAGQRRR